MSSLLSNLYRISRRRSLKHQLDRLTDHQLEDIGITRGDIATIALAIR